MRIDPPGCQACVFVQRQLGEGTGCLFHVGRTRAAPVVQAADSFQAVEPTVDGPGLFTVREYARLLVLRGRVRERPLRNRAL